MDTEVRHHYKWSEVKKRLLEKHLRRIRLRKIKTVYRKRRR